MMTAAQVKNLRREIYYVTGIPVTPKMLGRALGLSEKRAERGVREWEHAGPTGPAGVALTYLAQGLSRKLPEYIIGVSDEEAGVAYVIRLRWPRFIMMVPDQQIELYFISQWIDDPTALGQDNTSKFIAQAKNYFEANF